MQVKRAAVNLLEDNKLASAQVVMHSVSGLLPDKLAYVKVALAPGDMQAQIVSARESARWDAAPGLGARGSAV